MVQWLGLRASTAGGMGSIPGWGTKTPQAVQLYRKRKKETQLIMAFKTKVYFFIDISQGLQVHCSCVFGRG